jgi:hypothetical protein
VVLTVLGTCKIESYMEKLAFTIVCLSGVKVVMVIYACTLSRVAMSSSNGMDSCT